MSRFTKKIISILKDLRPVPATGHEKVSMRFMELPGNAVGRAAQGTAIAQSTAF